MSPIRKRIVRLLEVRTPSPAESTADSLLRNDDLAPASPSRRTWGSGSYVAFWVADSLNINTLMIASTAVSTGLPWWAAWLGIIIGYTFVSLLVVLMAQIAATYHIAFPILARSSFGVWGALWPTLNRSVMACIWYGVQAWIGGQCVTLVLRSLAPNYINLHNSLPASSGTDTPNFLSFFLFSLISLPIVLIKPEKIRYFFHLKAAVVPIALIAFFAWSIVDAHGLGPIVRQPASISGSTYGWAFVSAVMSCLSNMATLVVNIPDVGRLAKTRKSVGWAQLLTIPISFSVTSFIGIIVASSSVPTYGTLIWNPVDLLGERLNRSPYSAGDRAGVFFIAVSLIIGQIGTNVSANSLSAGHDLSALLPRFISIRRGALVAAIVGFCMCPWHLLSSANSFATYLSAYSLFLSSIAGTIMCDYYVVRRGLLNVPDLYSADKAGTYHYTAGIHWRAFAAYLSGIAISVTGFAGVIGAQVSTAAEHIYIVAYPVGFLASGLVYLVLCTIWPVAGSINIIHDNKSWLAPQSYEDDAWWPQDEEEVHGKPKDSLQSLNRSDDEHDDSTKQRCQLDDTKGTVTQLEA